MPTGDPPEWRFNPSPFSAVFRPPIVSPPFTEAFESVEKILRERHLEAVEKLTREQFIEAMGQALASGDFMRNVTIGETLCVGNSMTYEHKQAITYEPFRECARLKARVAELEAELDRTRDEALDSDHL